VTADDQVKAYIKKIMSQLKDWMYGGKISKLVVVITSKETGEHVERWQFDVSRQSTSLALVLTCAGPNLREEREIQKLKTGSRQRELRSWVGQPIYASHLEAH
jgi:hypothetical protein